MLKKRGINAIIFNIVISCFSRMKNIFVLSFYLFHAVF